MNKLIINSNGYISIERKCCKCLQVKNIKKFKSLTSNKCTACSVKERPSYKARYGNN